MNEIEYLNEVDRRVQIVFDLAIEARDQAQAAIVAAQALKADLLRRKIELQRAELEAREQTK